MSHAKFSPSQSKTWLRCALYPSMASMFPNISGPAAEKGTALHEAAETCLKNGGLLPDDKEDRETITDYVWLVGKTLADSDGGVLLIEEKVEIFEDCWGTADAAIVERFKLHVFDFKSGKSPIHAFENTQLILYALGLIKKHQLGPDINADLWIVQPNKSSGKTKDVWHTSVEELLEWEPKFVKAITRAKKSDPPAIVGKHCWFCPGKMHCAEYRLSLGAAKDSLDF